MSGLEWLEAASYIVTIIGLPLAIGVYIFDRRRDRQTDEEEIFLRLSDEYADFMRLVIDNADLHLLSPDSTCELTEEQLERKHVLFAILVSLFERAYVLVYEDNMSRQQTRLWQSWEDYMTGVVRARRLSCRAARVAAWRRPGFRRDDPALRQRAQNRLTPPRLAAFPAVLRARINPRRSPRPWGCRLDETGDRSAYP